ncbi:uncharacterized protein METZ01_LOCUS208992, partial [marine metagenome]
GRTDAEIAPGHAAPHPGTTEPGARALQRRHGRLLLSVRRGTERRGDPRDPRRPPHVRRDHAQRRGWATALRELAADQRSGAVGGSHGQRRRLRTHAPHDAARGQPQSESHTPGGSVHAILPTDGGGSAPGAGTGPGVERRRDGDVDAPRAQAVPLRSVDWV